MTVSDLDADIVDFVNGDVLNGDYNACRDAVAVFVHDGDRERVIARLVGWLSTPAPHHSDGVNVPPRAAHEYMSVSQSPPWSMVVRSWIADARIDCLCRGVDCDGGHGAVLRILVVDIVVRRVDED